IDGQEYKLTMRKHEEKGWMPKFRFSSVKAVALVFLNSMATGDYERAKNYATEESHTAIDMVSGMNPSTGNDAKQLTSDIEIIDVVVIGDEAKVRYKEEMKELTLEMVKVGHEWKASYSKGGPDGSMDPGMNLDNALDLSKAMDGVGDLEEFKDLGDLEKVVEDAAKELKDGLKEGLEKAFRDQ
ncbi:MAG: hypothetical protein AAF570_22530, partial [Bacteroidota bacterium]